jgi:hypothetical protein
MQCSSLTYLESAVVLPLSVRHGVITAAKRIGVI